MITIQVVAKLNRTSLKISEQREYSYRQILMGVLDGQRCDRWSIDKESKSQMNSKEFEKIIKGLNATCVSTSVPDISEKL